MGPIKKGFCWTRDVLVICTLELILQMDPAAGWQWIVGVFGVGGVGGRGGVRSHFQAWIRATLSSWDQHKGTDQLAPVDPKDETRAIDEIMSEVYAT